MQCKKIKEILLQLKQGPEKEVLVNKELFVDLLEEVLATRRKNTARIRKGLCTDK